MSDTNYTVASHFTDAGHQHEAATLGMWTFLVSEVMFFGGLFTGYAVYRAIYPEGFAEASRRLDVPLGTLNTCILIGSSLTMALAVRSAQTGAGKHLVRYLLATIGLGSVFLAIKFSEYAHKFHEHLVPGKAFSFDGLHAGPAQMFFSIYFVMTGMHALHMIVGICILTVLVILARRGRFSQHRFTPVEMVGLYWHFVDIVWIFLFPLLYLIGRHE